MSTPPQTDGTPARDGAFPGDPRKAAELYLLNRWVPVPLHRGTKKPTLDGYQNLRPVPEDLDGLFPPGRPINVGLLLGAPSDGLIDCDLDCMEAVRAAPLLMPRTDLVSGRASKPRSHYWYQVADPPGRAAEKFKDPDKDFYRRHANGDDALEKEGLLLELRSTGGQTAVAPSLHEEGEAVVWHSFANPARVALDELRVALGQLAAASLLARHWPARGCRHDLALALAGGLLRKGWDVQKAARFLNAVYVAGESGDVETKLRAIQDTDAKLKAGAEVTGWPTAADLLTGDGKRIVAQVCRWLGLPSQEPARRPRRQLLAYRPMPTHALPEPLRSLVEQGASSIGCDPAFIALPALAAVASLIGNTRRLRLKRDWTEPAVVWSVIVGDSGTLKSPAYELPLRPLKKLQFRMMKDYRQALKDYEGQKAEYDRERRKRERGGGDALPAPEKPTCRRLICGDVTIEKLALLLEENPRGLLLGRDEVGGWLASFSRYKGKAGGTDLPNWLEMHRAGTVLVDRKTGERTTVMVPNAAVSVTGGIQPGTLACALTPEYVEAGLGARVLMARPPKQKKRWSETEVAPEVLEGYDRLVERLLGLEFDTDEEGDPVPFIVRLTPQAKSLWVAFFDSWADVQFDAEGALAAAFSKLEAYAARFALLHHIVTHANGDDCDPVEAPSMGAAIELTRWFAAEAERIYAMLAETAEEREERRLVEFVQHRGGRVTTRDLQRGNSSKYPSSPHAEAALDTLVAAGFGQWVEGGSKAEGGHPARCFLLHPTHDTSDTRSPGPTPESDSLGDEPPDTRSAPCSQPNNGPDPDIVVSAYSAMASVDGASAPAPQVSEVSCVGCGEHGGGEPAGVPGESASAGEVSGASVGHVPEAEGVSHADGSSAPEGAGPACRARDSSDTRPYTLITDPSILPRVLQAVSESAHVGVDTETSGLDPRADRIRLLSLATDRGLFLIDCFAVDPRPLLGALPGRPLIFHNAPFDLGFLGRLSFVPGVVHDTMLLSRLLHGTRHPRGFHGLAACALRELGLAMDKAEQTSDWSGTLTADQLRYAARDAEVLAPLFAALDAQVGDANLGQVAEIERRCLPAVAWMSDRGVDFDAHAWAALAVEAAANAKRLAAELHAAAPECPGYLLGMGGWDWESPKQVREALALLGFTVDGTDDDTLAAVPHPFAALLRDYRSASKLATTYGTGWTKDSLHGGRLYPAWSQLGSDSGRMSCRSPNAQNLPRDKRYRKCFVASAGRVLVKADYSQVELRIAAKVANEERMLAAYRAGEDLHTLTAQHVLGASEVTKEQRQLAKAVNFGLLYGMGVKGFRAYALAQYGLRLSEQDAGRYREAFFAAYPGLRRWHRSVPKAPMATRTLAGRRRQNVERYTEKLNTPVQGTGADGLKLALALLWERRAECTGAFPVLAVHDEIVVECDAGQADAVKGWVSRAMIDALAPLIDPVPVEVETTVGRTWAGD